MVATEKTSLVVPNGGGATNGSGNTTGGEFGKRNLLLWVVAVILLVGAAFYGGKTFGSSSDEHQGSVVQEEAATSDDNEHVDSSNNNKSKYSATQFISFTINTMGGVADKGECDEPWQSVDPNFGFCYLGNADDVDEDIVHRLEVIEDVLHRIKKDTFAEVPAIDSDHNVLKIFMLPEFFWRGPYGAYSTDRIFKDDSVFHQVMNRLRELAADDFFEDYLFVFGTVIAGELTNKQATSETANAQDIAYYNVAAVMRGGAMNRHAYAVTKKYISGADFLSRNKLPNPHDENKYAYSELDPRLVEVMQSRNTTVITDNILEIDGLRIGLEICLDHRMGALWNHLHTNNLPLVDLLLVTSAGMAIERGPNPIVPGGVVYLSDGDAASAACMRTDHHDEFDPLSVCREDVGGPKHIPIGGPGYSSFFSISACWDMEDSDLLKGYYSLYQPQGCAYTLQTYGINVMDEFSYYPPSIEIYPTVNLPESVHN